MVNNVDADGYPINKIIFKQKPFLASNSCLPLMLWSIDGAVKVDRVVRGPFCWLKPSHTIAFLMLRRNPYNTMTNIHASHVAAAHWYGRGIANPCMSSAGARGCIYKCLNGSGPCLNKYPAVVRECHRQHRPTHIMLKFKVVE